MSKIYTYQDWADQKCPRPESFLKPYDSVSMDVVQGIMTGQELDEKQLYVQEKTCSDILGKCGLYNTFSRPSENHPFKYMGLCFKGETVNRHPESAERVFIISQFAATNDCDMDFYLQFAAALARKEWQNGRMPVVPHLYFPHFLDDGFDFERDYAIIAGHMLMQTCTRVRVFMIDKCVSDGMASDISYATLALGLEPEIINVSMKSAKNLIATGEF